MRRREEEKKIKREEKKTLVCYCARHTTPVRTYLQFGVQMQQNYYILNFPNTACTSTPTFHPFQPVVLSYQPPPTFHLFFLIFYNRFFIFNVQKKYIFYLLGDMIALAAVGLIPCCSRYVQKAFLVSSTFFKLKLKLKLKLKIKHYTLKIKI
jgi:hypothetical protein